MIAPAKRDRSPDAPTTQRARSEWLLTEREIRAHTEESATRNLLSRASGRAKSRCFSGAPLTGFGEFA